MHTHTQHIENIGAEDEEARALFVTSVRQGWPQGKDSRETVKELQTQKTRGNL